MDTQELAGIVNGFKGKRIIVVGDFCLDEYLIHNPALGDNVSVETGQAPFSVFQRRYSPGGAGNVAVNVAALGGQCYASGAIGNTHPAEDAEGIILTNLLDERRVLDFLLRTPRHTPTYMKPVNHETGEESPRVDWVNSCQVSNTQVDSLLTSLADILKEYSCSGCAVIINDQIKMGLSSPYFIAGISELRNGFPNAPFLVDSRRHAAEYARPGMIMKMNSFEAVNLFGESEYQDPLAYIPEDAVVPALRKIFDKTGCDVFVTRGSEGMLVFDGRGSVIAPTLPLKEPFDTCGAGDTAISALALCYALNMDIDPVKAAYIANAASNITCEQVGTTGVARPEQVIERLSMFK